MQRKNIGLYAILSLLFVWLSPAVFAQELGTDFYVRVNLESDGIIIVKYTGNDSYIRIPAEIEGLPVTEIGREAFAYNLVLEKIDLPKTIKVIGAWAFANTAISSIDLSENVVTIDKEAFINCKSLREVKLSPAIKVIGSRAFAHCQTLNIVTIPESVKNINFASDVYYPDPFYGCNLTVASQVALKKRGYTG